MSPVDYGTDWSTYPDLSFGNVSGLEALAQALLRSLEDAEKALDLRLWLNDDLDTARVAEMERAVAAQMLVDERVQDASCTASQPTDGVIELDIRIVPADGSVPLRLVVAITDVGLQLLKAERTS
jgi:hypothetical protein